MLTARPQLIRLVRFLLWGVVAMVLVAIAIGRLTPGAETRSNAVQDYASAFGGPFRLIDPAGRIVTDRDLKGKPFAIFFGFTRCPEVCPTTLQTMARLRGKLGKDADRLNLVFVSLDPEHDKPADIGRYLTLFATPIIGLTGSDTQLAAIVKGYHIFHEKVPMPNGDYLIDHTATVFLMDRDGAFSSTISPGEAEAVALRKLQKLVRS